jgi:hypothetical protein
MHETEARSTNQLLASISENEWLRWQAHLKLVELLFAENNHFQKKQENY